MADNKVTLVLGAQWGDEGKGKLADLFANKFDICARCQGGNNAGHTIHANGVKYAFHMIPSGLVDPKCTAVIGSGVVLNVPEFFKELDELEAKGLKCRNRILISDRCQMVFGFHQIVDGIREHELGRCSIGTTKKGIGPAYSSKASRSGIRVHQLFHPEEFAEALRTIVSKRHKRYGDFEYDVEAELVRYQEYAKRLRPMIIDTVEYFYNALNKGLRILVEGANALMLDIDFGTYPYVTSSNTCAGGVCTGLGIPPCRIGKTLGVVKAYTTRVGAGPFPTEDTGELGKKLREVGAEYGVTTGRPRRCGWLDLVVLRYSNMINGYTSINLTKLDVLDHFDEIPVGVSYTLNGKEVTSYPADLDSVEEVKVNYVTMPGWKQSIAKCRKFEELPPNCQKYVRFIEEHINVPVEWIGVGVDREDMIHIDI